MRAIFILLFAFACASCESDLRGKIKNRINNDCKNHPSSCVSIIKLKDITKFKWDRFYYFSAGVSLNQINDTLGVHFPYWEDLSESVVFMRSDSIIYHEAYGLADPDGAQKGGFYFNLGNLRSYTPDNAVFRIQKTVNGGYEYYELTPVMHSE